MLSNPPNTFGYLNTLETHSAEYMCSMFNEVAFQNSPSFCCRLSLSYTRKFIYYGWQVIENHFPLSEGYSINSRLDKARLATRAIAKYQASHVTYQLKISSINLWLADQSQNWNSESGFLIGHLATNLWRKFQMDRWYEKLSTMQGF